MADKAVFFVDGSNWYHSLRDAGVDAPGDLSYTKICKKLAGPRDWVATNYYVGQVTQGQNAALYGQQRSFIAKLKGDDGRIGVFFGRLERRNAANPAALELATYLSNLPAQIDQSVFQELHRIARENRRSTFYVEKAVDVMLAVDFVLMAERNEFDAAYLLTADGDYTPAVDSVRSKGKKVYAVSCRPGARLASSVNSFIRLDEPWFQDCYRS